MMNCLDDMRAVANAFLVLFLSDAVLSLADELLEVTLDSVILHPARTALATAVAAGGLLLYVGLGITPRLPKRVFMPLTLFIPWALFGGLPVPLYVGLEWNGPTLSAIQVLLGGMALLLVRYMTGGRRWLFTDASLAGPSFSGRNSLVFFGGNLLLGPIALALYLGICLSLVVEHVTGGFVHLDSRGVRAEEREYVRGKQHVHLIAMMHVGQREYYEQVLASLPVEDAVVLAEGVSDERQLIPEGISYGKLASRLGLDAQEQVPIDTGERIIREADVDLSDFSTSTVELLRNISQLIQADDATAVSRAYRELSEHTSRPDTVSTALDEILDLRNQRLMQHITAALEEYAHVIVPWGAAHMPAVEQAIVELGFELSDTTERSLVRF